jgi:hypothetical protein
MVSVNVGRCRLCCSQAAIGATRTVPSRGTWRSSGQVISLKIMEDLVRQFGIALDVPSQARHTRPVSGVNENQPIEAEFSEWAL